VSGSEDRLHIASVFGREIAVMDPETGKIIDRLGTDLGVEGPDDLAFGPDGSVYWTSILTGEVGRLSPDGIKSGQLLTPGINPITFSDDGRLFVGQCFLGHALYELDPEFADPPRLIADNFTCLNGMDWGPDDRLYSAMPFDQQVVSIDVDSCTSASDPWTECDIQIAADGFGVPPAAKFDSQGRLHVIDALSGEILRVDTQTGVKGVIAHLTPKKLDNLAFDSRDRLFVSNSDDGSIHQVLPGGQTRTVSKGGMILPGGVAVLARPRGGDSVFVADWWSIREFNGLTGRPKSIEHHFFDPAGLTGPFTVSPARDAAGTGESHGLCSAVERNSIPGRPRRRRAWQQ
jgi:sugar lactone lactonase YvrE